MEIDAVRRCTNSQGGPSVSGAGRWPDGSDSDDQARNVLLLVCRLQSAGPKNNKGAVAGGRRGVRVGRSRLFLTPCCRGESCKIGGMSEHRAREHDLAAASVRRKAVSGGFRLGARYSCPNQPGRCAMPMKESSGADQYGVVLRSLLLAMRCRRMEASRRSFGRAREYFSGAGVNWGPGARSRKMRRRSHSQIAAAGRNVLSKDNKFESDREKTRWRKLDLLCCTRMSARRTGVGRE